MSQFLKKELLLRQLGRAFDSYAEFDAWRTAEAGNIPHLFLISYKDGTNTTQVVRYYKDTNVWATQLQGNVKGDTIPIGPKLPTSGVSTEVSRKDHVHPLASEYYVLTATNTTPGSVSFGNNELVVVRSSSINNRITIGDWVAGKKYRIYAGQFEAGFLSGFRIHSVGSDLYGPDGSINQSDITIQPGQCVTLEAIPKTNAGDVGKWIVRYADLGLDPSGTSNKEAAIANHNHDTNYYTKAVLDTRFDGFDGSRYQMSWSNITGKPSTFSPSAHNHDTDYYTKAVLDTRFSNYIGGKYHVDWGNIDSKPSTFSPSVHNHDTDYYTKAVLDTRFESFIGGKYQVSWDNLTAIPLTFAPSYHTHDTDYYPKLTLDSRFDGFDGSRYKVSWYDISGTPSTFTPSIHNHQSYEVQISSPNKVLGSQGASGSAVEIDILSSSLLGRKSSGNITSLSIVDLKQLLGYNETGLSAFFSSQGSTQVINSITNGDFVKFANQGNNWSSDGNSLIHTNSLAASGILRVQPGIYKIMWTISYAISIGAGAGKEGFHISGYNKSSTPTLADPGNLIPGTDSHIEIDVDSDEDHGVITLQATTTLYGTTNYLALKIVPLKTEGVELNVQGSSNMVVQRLNSL